MHAEYDTFDLSNDIALVITKEDIEFNDNIKTISLPEQTDIAQLYAEGAPATVIGLVKFIVILILRKNNSLVSGVVMTERVLECNKWIIYC